MGGDDIVAEWNERIHTWMITGKQVAVAGLAHVSDGAVFAAACTEGDPVDMIYKPPYEVSMPQEDGTDKMTPVNEPDIIKFAAENLRAPNGLWIAGQKYKVVRTEDACDQGKHTFKTLFCAKPKGGCCVVVTPGGITILAIYSEELGQQSVGAKAAALAFGEYLADHGY